MDLLNEFERTAKPASIGRRWGAALIDYFIWMVVKYSIVYLLGETIVNEDGDIIYGLTGANFLLTSFLPWFILLPVLEGMNDGKTIGKAILGIRAVDRNGKPVSFGPAFLRHLFDFIDYLPILGIVGVVVASNTAEKQRVGDLIAGTSVVRD